MYCIVWKCVETKCVARARFLPCSILFQFEIKLFVNQRPCLVTHPTSFFLFQMWSLVNTVRISPWRQRARTIRSSSWSRASTGVSSSGNASRGTWATLVVPWMCSGSWTRDAPDGESAPSASWTRDSDSSNRVLKMCPGTSRRPIDVYQVSYSWRCGVLVNTSSHIGSRQPPLYYSLRVVFASFFLVVSVPSFSFFKIVPLSHILSLYNCSSLTHSLSSFMLLRLYLFISVSPISQSLSVVLYLSICLLCCSAPVNSMSISVICTEELMWHPEVSFLVPSLPTWSSLTLNLLGDPTNPTP